MQNGNGNLFFLTASDIV